METTTIKIKAELNIMPAQFSEERLDTHLEQLEQFDVSEYKIDTLAEAIFDAIDDSNGEYNDIVPQKQLAEFLAGHSLLTKTLLMHLLGDQALVNFAKDTKLPNISAVVPSHFEFDPELKLVFTIQGESISESDIEVIQETLDSQISDGWFEDGNEPKMIDLDVRMHPVDETYHKLMNAGLITLSTYIPRSDPDSWFDSDNNVILDKSKLIEMGSYPMMISANILL